MTKKEIIETIHRNTNIDKGIIIIVIDEFFTLIKESLSNNDPVTLRTFGTFGIKTIAGHYQHVRKSDTIFVPQHSLPFFKPGKDFKKQIMKSNNMIP